MAMAAYIIGMQEIDADSFALVGSIANTPGVRGIAIASEAGRGYISAGKSDAVCRLT
jgi:hypothetical protein